LIPRVALTQTTLSSPITSPATSLMVYNTAAVNDVTPGYFYWDGTKWMRLEGGKGDITCNTANFVLKSNGTDATCSQIFDNGTNVGIGTTIPTAKLDINGNIASNGSAGTVETGTISTTGWHTVAVTFPVAFSSVPHVVVTFDNSGTGDIDLRWSIQKNSLTTTGFTIDFYVVTVGIAVTAKFHWMRFNNSRQCRHRDGDTRI